MPVPTLLRNWVDPLPTFVSDALEDPGDPFAKRLSIFESTALSDLGWTREDELAGSWIIWSNDPLKDSKTFFRFDTGDPNVSDIGSFTTNADVQGSCVIVRSYPSLADAQNKTNLVFAELLRIAEDDDTGSSDESQPYIIVGDSRGFYFFPGIQQNFRSSGTFPGFSPAIFAWLSYVGELPTFSGTPGGTTIISAGTETSGQFAPIRPGEDVSGLNGKITGAIDGTASENLHSPKTIDRNLAHLGEPSAFGNQGPTLEFWLPLILIGRSTNQPRAILPGLMGPLFALPQAPSEGTTVRTINTQLGQRSGVIVPIASDMQSANVDGALFFDLESDWDSYHVF